MAVETNQQTICPHCEEMVHRYAARCPYCQHSLALPTIESQIKIEEKIIEQGDAGSKITEMSFKDPSDDTSIQEEKKPSSQGMFQSLLPLICLLSGSFFFFFGLIIRFFSQQGRLVLQWSESDWPYFVFPAFFIGIIGIILMSRSESSD